MSSKRDRRRALLADDEALTAPPALRLITFGTARHAAAHCTCADAPAEFAVCLDCPYNRGAHGAGIRCAHRFGIDPTLVDGRPTQYLGDEIVPL